MIVTDVDTHGGDVEVGLHAELLRPVHGGADVVAAPPPQRAQPRVAGHQQPRPGPAHTIYIFKMFTNIFVRLQQRDGAVSAVLGLERVVSRHGAGVDHLAHQPRVVQLQPARVTCHNAMSRVMMPRVTCWPAPAAARPWPR